VLTPSHPSILFCTCIFVGISIISTCTSSWKGLPDMLEIGHIGYRIVFVPCTAIRLTRRRRFTYNPLSREQLANLLTSLLDILDPDHRVRQYMSFSQNHHSSDYHFIAPHKPSVKRGGISKLWKSGGFLVVMRMKGTRSPKQAGHHLHAPDTHCGGCITRGDIGCS
jgi:hypothetical protein